MSKICLGGQQYKRGLLNDLTWDFHSKSPSPVDHQLFSVTFLDVIHITNYLSHINVEFYQSKAETMRKYDC